MTQSFILSFTVNSPLAYVNARLYYMCMIDYAKSLNEAQYAAATADDGAVLVIAGAGSGKTRTIVYRLAWLYEHGVAPTSMLLLTFTRKAAQEMLHRASLLLEQGLSGVQGGTFHAFAYGVLRQYRPSWLEGRHFSIMDSADIASAIAHCKESLSLGKGDRSFPKTQTIVGIISKARNKEISIEEVLRRESQHLLPHCEDICKIATAYTAFRRTHGLLDYDDLLFELENLLQECVMGKRPEVQYLRQRYQYIMVDEYQDTNLVQARIVRLLGSKEFGGSGNVMAVGDDAQSIYAFRGANVKNILDFPDNFADTQIIRLEENYRSTQPILDIANTLLKNAAQSYDKKLFTSRQGGLAVKHIQPASDRSQADMVVKRVRELMREQLPHEIAVLFRAGFHSYAIEAALQREGIAFRKYGGIRFSEASHIKDILSYARLILNPFDLTAFERVAVLHKGIGKKTMQKLYTVACSGDSTATEKAFAKYHDFLADIRCLDRLRAIPYTPAQYMAELITQYQPRLEAEYPDDWPRRLQGLEEIQHLANGYTDLDLFIADLVLDSNDEKEVEEQCISLSTIHSAKGLEWNAVLIIDLVEDRFPSRHASADLESFEEERRLMYVACTRARQCLELYAPSTLYMKGSGPVHASPSPFMRELTSARENLCEEWYESYGGQLHQRGQRGAFGFGHGETAQRKPVRLLPPTEFSKPHQYDAGDSTNTQSRNNDNGPLPLGYCHHKIFGRGKMIKFVSPDKYQVNFSGFGLKTILQDFLTPE